jgi:poly(3-hydroxybutyrate) depolymerase
MLTCKAFACVAGLTASVALVGCGGCGGSSRGSSVVVSTPAATTPSGVAVGVVRAYSLYVPPNFQPNVSGLVIALHGACQSAANFEPLTQLTPKAQQTGFAIVYPDGINADWHYYFTDPSVDGVAFMRALIGALQTSIHPDPKHFYTTGFSNSAAWHTAPQSRRDRNACARI